MSSKPPALAKALKAAKAPKMPAGRPPTGYTYDPKSIPGLRDAARAKAAAQLDLCVDFFIAVRDGQIRATMEQVRAAENLCDRAGLARKTDLDLSSEDGTVKLWALGTYRDKDGAHHELPRDTTGDPPPA